MSMNSRLLLLLQAGCSSFTVIRKMIRETTPLHSSVIAWAVVSSAGDAHRNYDNDERVIKMIACGVNEGADPVIKEHCEWLDVR